MHLSRTAPFICYKCMVGENAYLTLTGAAQDDIRRNPNKLWPSDLLPLTRPCFLLFTTPNNGIMLWFHEQINGLIKSSSSHLPKAHQLITDLPIYRGTELISYPSLNSMFAAPAWTYSPCTHILKTSFDAAVSSDGPFPRGLSSKDSVQKYWPMPCKVCTGASLPSLTPPTFYQLRIQQEGLLHMPMPWSWAFQTLKPWGDTFLSFVNYMLGFMD